MYNLTNCMIHTFDCTVREASPPQFIVERLRFYKYCITSRNSSYLNYISYDSIIEMTTVFNAPLFLKLDVEGFEWQTLREIASSKYSPPQMDIELHLNTRDFLIEATGSPHTVLEAAQLIDELNRHSNYFVTAVKKNCDFCAEVLLTRVCKRKI